MIYIHVGKLREVDTFPMQEDAYCNTTTCNFVFSMLISHKELLQNVLILLADLTGAK